VKIQDVTIENYASYHGRHSIDLADRGLVLVLGDNRDEPRMNSNGAAKSSIFEALDWCLFGVVPKGDHVDSIINDESSFAAVEARLLDEDRGVTLCVQRSKQRGKAVVLQYAVDAEKCAALDTRETQRALEAELGLDRDVFHAAVFYAQSDSLGFAESTEARRMELLSKILPELRQIDDWLPLAKEKAKVCEAELQQYRAAYARAQTRAEEAAHAISGLDAQVQAWEENRRQRLLAIERGRQQWQERVHTIRAVVAEQEKLRVRLGELQPPVALDVSHLEKAEQDAVSNRATWEAQGRSMGEQRVREQRRIATLAAQREGSCSLCGQPVTADHLARELGQLRSDVLRFEASEAEARTNAEGWGRNLGDVRQALEQAWAQVRDAERAYQSERAAIEGRLASSERAQVEYEKTNQAIADLDREHAAQMAAPNPVQQQKEQARDRASALSREAEVAGGQVQAWQHYLELCEFWVGAFGPKGLRNYVLDHRLKEMTDAANRWVQLLTAGTIWIRFETQKMGRTSKKLSNEITIRVFRFNPGGKITERNFRSWSGGEKRRVAWGIDFGLSRLIAARSKKRYDLLILDEVFRHVDSAGGEAVVEMLQELRKARSSIFVVEHDGGFQSHFENRWLVRKQNARSSVQVVEQGGSHGQEMGPQRETRSRKKAVSAGASPKTRARANRRGSTVSPPAKG
jgi:DNA repair exonuclease SbcCD ATPase subunit